MTGTLRHRGPDDEGQFIDARAPAMVGVRRLSVIDLRTGHQPVSNEDGTVQVVFNGEIYNFADLRHFLETKGHRFSTHTDTEVIPHLYEEYGSQCVHALRGMFAFALWDTSRQRLLLARDRLGEKPLYYWHGGNKLVFGSEIKALLAHPEVPRRIDRDALELYLSLGYIPAPDTMLAGVRKLAPGHCLIWAENRVRLEPYWAPVFLDDAQRIRASDAIEELRWRLEEAVRLRLVADVPVGVLLSGGVDSGTVAALMAAASARPVKAFTVGFDVGGWYDEVADARQVAAACRLEHYHTTLSASDVSEILPKIAWHLDEPVADPAALATYAVCQAARKEVTVVLTGEGADELFGGYPRYWWFERAARLHRSIPAPIRRGVLAALDALPVGRVTSRKATLLLADLPDADRYLRWVDMGYRVADQRASRLLACHLHAESGKPLVHQLMNVDLNTWLADDILAKVDRMSMAVSLEARVPFLDHRLVEFVLRLPANLKVRGKRGKWLLRQSSGALLPARIRRRRKHAFGVPVGEWIRGPLRQFAADHLLASDSPVRDLDFARVRHLLEHHLDGHANNERAIWTLLCFDLWSRAHLNGRYAP